VPDIKAVDMHSVKHPVQYHVTSEDGDGHVAYKPRVYKWLLNHTNNLTHFGENVLASTERRLSSAVAKSWSVLYRLDQEALEKVSTKHPEMGKIWKYLRTHKQTRLMRAVRITLDSIKTRFSNLPRLLVKVEGAVNLPNMDGFLGSCDGLLPGVSWRCRAVGHQSVCNQCPVPPT